MCNVRQHFLTIWSCPLSGVLKLDRILLLLWLSLSILRKWSLLMQVMRCLVGSPQEPSRHRYVWTSSMWYPSIFSSQGNSKKKKKYTYIYIYILFWLLLRHQKTWPGDKWRPPSNVHAGYCRIVHTIQSRTIKTSRIYRLLYVYIYVYTYVIRSGSRVSVLNEWISIKWDETSRIQEPDVLLWFYFFVIFTRTDISIWQCRSNVWKLAFHTSLAHHTIFGN